MNTRQREVLRMLLADTDRYYVVRDMAMKLNCSEKTIRNNFEAIDLYLSEHYNATLVRKPGFGVKLNIEEHEQMELFDQLFRSAQENEYEQDDNRIAAIAYKLLMNTKPTTLQELAEQYFVNRSVIRKDLDTLDHWLVKWGLSIISKQKVGITIEGNEKEKRAALSKVYQLIGTTSTQFIKKKFEVQELNIVTRELRQLEEQETFRFTDEAFDNLLIHTLLMIRRTKLKQPISFSEQEKAFIQEKKEYQGTRTFIQELERLFSIHFSEDEISYLTAHLLGAKIRSNTRMDTVHHQPLIITAEVTELVDSLLRKISSLSFVDFTKDSTLTEGLRIHLSSTINRLSYGLSVTNPLLQDIKKMYPYMFDMVIYSTNQLKQSYHFTIPEDEVAYLTLHFQAAIERLNKQNTIKKRIVTVCHMGTGISQILRTKLECNFSGLQVLDSIRKADLGTYLDKNSVDFIVSTVPLENLTIPHIVVSPLLESADIKKIDKFLDRLDEQSNEAATSILQMYTRPVLIFPQVEVSHRFEIIEQLANNLYAQGFVDQEYAHQALLRERLSSTTIGGGIAIPHGDPKLVKQSQIAVATLKEPLEWEQEKVWIVFMLALRNEEQENTKKLFHRLSLLSEQPSLNEQLIYAKQPEDIFSLL
ncbi:BglG family transcription antiterminator [Paenibacillus uliginis]|nr:BglG family transcription antiterminator [Paenibacillus uliginis]